MNVLAYTPCVHLTLLLCGVMTTAFAAAAPTEMPQAAEGGNTASPATEGIAEPIPTPDRVPLYPAEVKQSEENGVTRIEEKFTILPLRMTRPIFPPRTLSVRERSTRCWMY